MKKLIKTEGTEFEQNLKDLAIIETTDRAGKPVMIDSADFNEAFENGESGAKALIDVGQAQLEDNVNATAGTAQVVVNPSEGKDAMKKVTIAAVTAAIDSNIKAENIKKDVVILGVTGTYEG